MKSLATDLVTDVDGSCGGSVSPPFVCVSILPHDISKIDAARIIKLVTEMFHDESREYSYFEVQRSKVKGHNVRVGLQTERNVAAAAAYASYPSFPCCNAPPHQQCWRHLVLSDHLFNLFNLCLIMYGLSLLPHLW